MSVTGDLYRPSIEPHSAANYRLCVVRRQVDKPQQFGIPAFATRKMDGSLALEECAEHQAVHATCTPAADAVAEQFKRRYRIGWSLRKVTHDRGVALRSILWRRAEDGLRGR